MKTWIKTAAIATAASAFGLFCLPSTAKADSTDYGVKVQINNQLINFPDGQPFIDANNRTQVPLRFVSENLGYQVQWRAVANQVEVTVSKNGMSVSLETGKPEAVVNGQAVSMDSDAKLLGDRTYVPLRFLSQAFGIRVQWDNADSVAILDADRQYHGSAYHKVDARLHLIDTAEQYLRTPYVWGGTTPNGFDCSGFIQYVFAKNGENLPRTTGSLFANAGRYTDAPQVGDLVFFATYKSSASHVGIYIGNNQFISATSSHGVHIDSFSNPYWGPRYLGAKHLPI